MGNYTEIEKEFNDIFTPEIKNIVSNGTKQGLPDQTIGNIVNSTRSIRLSEMRKKKMKELSDLTGRNVICYVSAWLQMSQGNNDYIINDNDTNGFMNAIAGLDRTKGLDLLLHTPGGVVSATESIVNYLRKMFNNDIRVIVPHMAMSAGTMIACSSKEILMGKESSLGPIDPQYRNVPAQGVIKEFKKAMNETIKDPNRSLIWKEIISQYRPAFVGECDNIIRLSNELAKGWLSDCMFKDDKNKKTKVNKILKEIGSHETSKIHDRHYDYEKLKSIGLNVTSLEDNQELQDKVLSLYHSYLLTIYQLPNVVKLIESQNGQSLIITGKR